ncbi:hypothetical protein NHP190002_12300 [Helicobacter ailurogastricus]|uniref:hypothetical protein n=1 Tax=Helicobacter ailurogastricus TaxID=1578720 RepID=UPI00244D8023|nr:hypothetical protein [Helicobacter ailurogastricus]GMB90528.1 hypothetical protein NHP190002_12300 [Helicobacter ailurogastricus]
MLDVFEIAEQLRVLKARQSIADLKVHCQNFKELWAQYKPLEDQQKRQEQVFKAKRQVLYRLLEAEPLKILKLYANNSHEDGNTKKAIDECYEDFRLKEWDTPNLDTYQKDKQAIQDKLTAFSKGVRDLLATARRNRAICELGELEEYYNEPRVVG